MQVSHTPAISPASAANMATHAWTKVYTEIMTSAVYAWPGKGQAYLDY